MKKWQRYHFKSVFGTQKVYNRLLMWLNLNICHTLLERLYTFITFLMCIRIFYFTLRTVLNINTNTYYILLLIHLYTIILYT